MALCCAVLCCGGRALRGKIVRAVAGLNTTAHATRIDTVNLDERKEVVVRDEVVVFGKSGDVLERVRERRRKRW